MREYSVQPEEVRVGGNILEPRGTSDFLRLQSKVSVVADSTSPTSESFLLEFNPLQLNLYLQHHSVAYYDTSIYIGDSVSLFCRVLANGITLEGKTVKFYSGETLLGSDDSDENGWAGLSYTPASVGTEYITAVFEGDSDYGLTSSNTYSLETMLIPVTVTVSADKTQMLASQSVTLSGSCTYHGATLNLYQNDVVVDTITVDANGDYSKTLSGFSRGTYTFGVVFEGDSTHTPGSASVTVVVGVKGNLQITIDNVTVSSSNNHVTINTADTYAECRFNVSGSMGYHDLEIWSGNELLTTTYVMDGTASFSLTCPPGTYEISAYVPYDGVYTDILYVTVNNVVATLTSKSITGSSTSSSDDRCYSLGLDSLGVDLSDKDFTLEWDCKCTKTGGRLCIGDKNSWSAGVGAGDDYVYIGSSASGSLSYGYRESDTTTWVTTGPMSTNTTYHFKIVKRGYNVDYYVNSSNKTGSHSSILLFGSDNSIYLQLWNNGTTTISNLILTLDG